MREPLTLRRERPSRRSGAAKIPDFSAWGHVWLARLVMERVAEYAQHSCGSERCLQTGMAWRRLTVDFAGIGKRPSPKHPDIRDKDSAGIAPLEDPVMAEIDLLRILTTLYRLGRCDDPFGRVLFRTFAPLSMEQNCSGELPGFGLPHLTTTPAEAICLVLRTLKRWCDWIEADLHLYAHSRCHQLPVSAPPGVEMASWHLPPSDDLVRAARACLGPEFQGDASEARLRSAGVCGAPAGAAQNGAPWLYQEVDTLVISLWPLLKRHNWSFKELLAVLRLLATSPNAYPCNDEQDLADYCSRVLGLRCLPQSKATGGSYGAGLKVALRLFPKS